LQPTQATYFSWDTSIGIPLRTAQAKFLAVTFARVATKMTLYGVFPEPAKISPT